MSAKMVKPYFTGFVCLFFFCGITRCCFSQSRTTAVQYDIRKMRLLLQTSAVYIFAVNQGVIDMDSAVIFAGKIQHVSEALAYNSDYYSGTALPGAGLMEKSDIGAAVKLAERSTGMERVLILLQLGSWYLHRTGNRKEDLSNAFGFLSMARLESQKIGDFRLFAAAGNILGDLASQAGKEKESRTYYLETADSCERIGDHEMLANTLNHEASSLGNDDSLKIPLFERSVALYGQLHEPERQIEVVEKLSVVYFSHGQLKQFRDIEFQLIAMEKAVGFRHLHYSYNALAFVDLVSGRLADALREANTSVDIMEETGDSLLSAYCYMQQAQTYSEIGRKEEALAIFDKVYRQYRGGPLIWYNLFIATVQDLLTMDRSKEALNMIQMITAKYPPPSILAKLKVAELTATSLQRLGNIKEASTYWAELVDIVAGIHQPAMDKDLADAYVLLSNFYIKTGKYDMADFYLAKARKIIPGKLTYFAKVYTPFYKYKIDSAKRNYLKALEDYQQYSALYDSTYGSSKIREYNLLLLQMEKEQKEKDIQLLNSKANIQAMRLARANTLKNITFIGIALLIIIILVIYKQYRTNRHNAREIGRKNNSLEHLLDEKEQLLHEKEYLLKEVHHRVKNNLQIIISLLESQSALQEHSSLLTLRSLKHRVYAMSLIHQKLYNFDSLQKIKLPEYINDLVVYLQDSFDTSSYINFVLDILPVGLDISHAIPLGLIINEAITNSVKYAFPRERKGVISIRTELLNSTHLKLTIADNGVGLPEDFGLNKVRSLGISLIRGLSADMDAQLLIENRSGTCITLDFTIPDSYG
jgi:two-component system, sensor histidine kinase PdtaS